MVFREESILERLKKLEEILDQLKDKEGIKLEEYRRDRDVQWIIERGCEVGSAAILDIGNHILAGVYQTPAEEYEQILEKLQERRVISESLYRELRGLGGFRNILVHGYLVLNPELVFAHYQKALASFPRFVVEIENWLETYTSRTK
jgi:uncharacterized protein YutE (UPF0331/DUF86 family)